MPAPRVVYIDCSPFTRRLFGARLEAMVPGMAIHEGDPDRATLERLVDGAAGVVNGHTVMDNALLAGASALRTIVYLGTGVSNYVDLEFARRRAIAVRVVRNYGDRTIAEHAFALVLAAARQVAAMDRALRRGEWGALEGIELRGKTMGVVGTGGTGAELARIAHGFGMEVLAWNRSGVPGDLPCRAVELDALLAAADVVSLHLALTAETSGLIDARRLALLKPSTILVNTARGAIVDEAALLAALRARRLAHAALDVFASEPLAPDHPLTRLDNVTLTSHAAYKTADATRRLVETALGMMRADLAALAAGRDLVPGA